jgi:hypothetical protein
MSVQLSLGIAQVAFSLLERTPQQTAIRSGGAISTYKSHTNGFGTFSHRSILAIFCRLTGRISLWVVVGSWVRQLIVGPLCRDHSLLFRVSRESLQFGAIFPFECRNHFKNSGPKRTMHGIP